jgi:hypothetical protein
MGKPEAWISRFDRPVEGSVTVSCMEEGTEITHFYHTQKLTISLWSLNSDDTLIMEAVSISEMSVNFYEPSQCKLPEKSHLHRYLSIFFCVV